MEAYPGAGEATRGENVGGWRRPPTLWSAVFPLQGRAGSGGEDPLPRRWAMICPMCIANVALAVAGVTTSGGATAIALRILGRKRGAKRKAEEGFPISHPRWARDRQDGAAGSERHR